MVALSYIFVNEHQERLTLSKPLSLYSSMTAIGVKDTMHNKQFSKELPYQIICINFVDNHSHDIGNVHSVDISRAVEFQVPTKLFQSNTFFL